MFLDCPCYPRPAVEVGMCEAKAGSREGDVVVEKECRNSQGVFFHFIHI